MTNGGHMESDRNEPLEVDEFDVDGSEDQDIEAAMRDALKAVEGDAEAESGEADGDSARSGSDELTALRKEVVELRDRSVRTLADFDNFRKRADRERDEQRRYAGSEVMRELLPVIDNLERALDSAGESGDLKQGVELIHKQIMDLLRRHGVERVEAQDRPFDPAVHEAVSRQEEEGLDVATVREELQTGYVMKDRLLRPSMVVVAVPTVPSADNGGVN